MNYEIREINGKYNMSMKIVQEMIDSSRFAGKDTNRLHDASQVERPIALAFQLDGIIKHFADEVLKNKYHKKRFAGLNTRFKEKVYIDDIIDVSLTKEDDIFLAEVKVDEKPVLEKTRILYANELESEKSKGEGGEYKLSFIDLIRFCEGIGCNNSPIEEFAISLSSAELIKQIESGRISGIKEAEKQGKEIVYASHNIKCYDKMSDLKLPGSILINVDSVKTKGPLWHIDISASKEGEILYKAKLSLMSN